MKDVSPSALPFTRADLDQTIPARFERVVQAFPDRLALTGSGRRWTYRALNEQANRVAHGIQACVESGPGSIAYVLDHSPEMVIAALAVLKAGKAYVALHPRMPLAAQTDVVADVAPDTILTSAAHDSRARELAATRCGVITLEQVGHDAEALDPLPCSRPQDASSIFYTSGTTGRPKGVVRSHRAVLHRVWLSAAHEGISPADRHSLLTHASFGASQWDMFGTLLQGATLSLFDVASQGLTALAAWIDAEQITLFHPPVLLFRRLLSTLQDEHLCRSVRLVALGGDVVLPADLEHWKRHFPRPCVVSYRYSSTETGLLTVSRIDHDTILSPDVIATGRPAEDKLLTVVDEDGQTAAPGADGELVVTSAFLSDGYWGHSEETKRAFVSDPLMPERRSYHTGDLGHLLPDGSFRLLGRRDHLVKIRGYRVDTREVEAALLRLEDVVEAAVVVVKEAEEPRLLAVVVMRDGCSLDSTSLRRRLGVLLPEWKLPARCVALPSLPTTLGGKVDRQRLRETTLHQHAADEEVTPVEQPTDDLEHHIAGLCQTLLRLPHVGRSDDFFHLGGDSLQATVLHLQIERLTGLQIPLEALFEHPSVGAMATVVRDLRTSAPGSPLRTQPILVPLRKTGALPPLFLLHGRPGRAFAKPHVLEILGAEQPVYAFQASGLRQGRIRVRTVPEMARQYVRAMKQVQPSGPYFLGSACAGGLVAVEMANQLRAAGDQVGPLLLIDPPSRLASDLVWWRRYRRLARLVAKRLLLRRSPDTVATKVILDFSIARVRFMRWHYDGPVLILRSADRVKNDGPSRGGQFGRHLTGDVQWFEVSATHRDVQKPGNELFARHLRQCADLAQAAIAGMRLKAQTK